MTGRKGDKGRSGGGGGKKRGDGSRMLRERVRTARGRRTSSTRWLDRQLNDPYVAEAQRLGYRSRAAFKLIQIDDRFHILHPGQRVLDLGAAPGGWSQVTAQRIGTDVKGKNKGRLVGIDLLEWASVPGAINLVGDFLAEDAPHRLTEALGGPADVVLSDMAASATGHRATDHLRIVGLCEAALDFAVSVLTPGGTFLAKVFKGGTEKTLLDMLKRHFTSVRHVKPPASRPESAETYVIAQGFKGKDLKKAGA